VVTTVSSTTHVMERGTAGDDFVVLAVVCGLFCVLPAMVVRPQVMVAADLGLIPLVIFMATFDVFVVVMASVMVTTVTVVILFVIVLIGQIVFIAVRTTVMMVVVAPVVMVAILGILIVVLVEVAVVDVLAVAVELIVID